MSIGKQIGNRYPEHVSKYINTMNYNYGINLSKLEKEAMLWFETLPVCYKEELEGISAGAAFPIEKLVQFNYCDRCVAGGCTSFVSLIDGTAWVGRNNDFIYLDSWGYVNILEAVNKISVMLFGMEGDNFSGTGINKEKLWLHYNWLPEWDTPSFDEKPLSPFVFIRLALETCKSIKEVERLIKNTIRDGGMNLFAVDGKTNEFAVYECKSRSFIKRENKNTYIAGANHYCNTTTPSDIDFSTSEARQSATEKLLSRGEFNNIPDDFIGILSNPEVEQSKEVSGTVYANVCCPEKEEIWYACGEFPAASKGKWIKINWPW
jgi:hypothetical protein